MDVTTKKDDWKFGDILFYDDDRGMTAMFIGWVPYGGFVSLNLGDRWNSAGRHEGQVVPIRRPILWTKLEDDK